MSDIGTNLSNDLNQFRDIYPHILLLLAGVLILIIILSVLAKLTRWWRLLKQPRVYLMLKPPHANNKQALATEQLFSVIHGIDSRGKFLKRLISPPLSISLEISSTRADGIRYIAGLPQSHRHNFESVVTSYLPETKITEVDNYISALNSKTSHSVRIIQKAHYAYPLQSQLNPELQDPLAYVTGAMTKLSGNEQILMQIVITPARIRQAEILAHKVSRNDELETSLKGYGRHSASGFILRHLNSLLWGAADTITYAYHGNSKNSFSVPQKETFQKTQAAQNLRPARILSPFEQQLYETVHQKLTKPLFRADIRLLIVSNTKSRIKHRTSSMKAALSAYSVPKYQSLVLNNHRWVKGYRLYYIKNRLPSLITNRSSILSNSELASLYHFPHPATTKTENISKSLSRVLPAPVSLKAGHRPDILLGENHFQGSTTAIGLTIEERQRHIYVVGGTGSGKTTMLLYAITQDIQNGKGVAVIDPHGDLSESILAHIPASRLNDVIYFNPDDLAYPIGLNLLELPEEISGDELLREKDLVTESAISVFRKIFSDDDSGGHRIEYILRNAIQTALTLDNPTLFTIFDLLNDTSFRKKVIRELDDKDLKNFWRNELGKAGDFQKVKMAAGITAKIGRFLFSASAKRILEQPRSTIDFDDILNSGKILICNFSKGLLGEDTSTLFGTTILAKIQMTALRRARITQTNRQPFFLYVDEFQNFATMAFVQMLSEARKYKLYLTMAEQTTQQQEQQRLVDIILANVGTVICFRSGSPADERLILPLFSPFIEAGEIANLPAYNFYMRISAIEPQEPLSGTTKLLEAKGNREMGMRTIRASRVNYAIMYSDKAVETSKKSKSNAQQSKPALVSEADSIGA